MTSLIFMKKLAGGSSVVVFQMRCQLYNIARRTFTLCLALRIFSPTAASSSAVRFSWFGSNVNAKEEIYSNLFFHAASLKTLDLQSQLVEVL
jgi:hypothetical protein